MVLGLLGVGLARHRRAALCARASAWHALPRTVHDSGQPRHGGGSRRSANRRHHRARAGRRSHVAPLCDGTQVARLHELGSDLEVWPISGQKVEHYPHKCPIPRAKMVRICP